MRYGIEIFDRFPEYVRGVVVARDIENPEGQEELRDMLSEIQIQTRQKIGEQDYREHPHIANWREAYRRFGVNPNKHSPSVEALVRQVVKGRQLKSINAVVDIFNYISLKYLVPSGADDLHKVVGDLRLRYARGDEIFVPLNGQQVEHPRPGEVIYADDEKVLCRCWNWRQGDHTKLTPEAKWVAVNVDCLPPVTRERAEEITREVAELIRRFCGGEVNYYILDRENPQIEI